MWHKYVSIAVHNYNTSYHTIIGCEPSRVFHARITCKILDIKLRIRPQEQPFPTSQIAQDILDQTEIIHQGVRKNAMQAHRLQSLLRQRGQRFRARRSRLCMRLSAARGSSME